MVHSWSLPHRGPSLARAHRGWRCHGSTTDRPSTAAAQKPHYTESREEWTSGTADPEVRTAPPKPQDKPSADQKPPPKKDKQ
jgi:hypothetical protein